VLVFSWAGLVPFIPGECVYGPQEEHSPSSARQNAAPSVSTSVKRPRGSGDSLLIRMS
jgi:hypothetical protein